MAGLKSQGGVGAADIAGFPFKAIAQQCDDVSGVAGQGGSGVQRGLRAGDDLEARAGDFGGTGLQGFMAGIAQGATNRFWRREAIVSQHGACVGQSRGIGNGRA